MRQGRSLSAAGGLRRRGSNDCVVGPQCAVPARPLASVLVFLALALFAAAMAQADVFGVAHRGGRVQGPENTLEVFQLTIDLGATPWLETDSWVSKDDVPVLHRGS